MDADLPSRTDSVRKPKASEDCAAGTQPRQSDSAPSPNNDPLPDETLPRSAGSALDLVQGLVQFIPIWLGGPGGPRGRQGNGGRGSPNHQEMPSTDNYRQKIVLMVARSASFGGLHESAVHELINEALSRRMRTGQSVDDLATVLPYDLQREIFQELRRISKSRAAVADHASTEESHASAEENDPEQDRQQPPGGPLGWVFGWVPNPFGYQSQRVSLEDMDRDDLRVGETISEPSEQLTASVGAASATSAAIDDFDLSASAASAFATASVIADSEKRDRFLASPEATDLRELVARARLLDGRDAAREFVEKVGITRLVLAMRVFQGNEQAMAVTALANLAVLMPSCRLNILTCDDESAFPSLVSLLTIELRSLVVPAAGWQTENQVSATHLLGSLAMAGGREGRVWRERMAKSPKLTRALEWLSKGPKVGGPESAARAARRAMSALGNNKWRPRAPGQRGLRILSLDGGGTRAVMTFEMLKHLKRITGAEIHDMFDIIAGTSTGAIIAGSLGINHKTVEQVEKLYRDLIGRVFAKHPTNMPKMLFTRAYYDTSVLETLLKRECGTGSFFDSTSEENATKVVVVSSIMSRNPKELHVFRNYTYPLGSESRYPGTTEAEIWEALRASSAAPTFFSEIRVNGELHADGAIVANNPAAVALHEAKCMYPGVPIELLVSIGNGKQAEELGGKDSVGWNDVLGTIIDSATATEHVHHTLLDLLPEGKYFRFNPSTRHCSIDETTPERLAYWVARTHEHIQGEQARFEELGAILRPQGGNTFWSRFTAALSGELSYLRSTFSAEDDTFLK